MSMRSHLGTIALLAMIGVAACAPRSAPYSTMGRLSSSGGPIESPILGEFVTYRSRLEGAKTRAREGLERAGYALTVERERTMMFTRRIGGRALRLDVRLMPSAEGMLRRWEAELGAAEGPRLTEEIARLLQQEIHEILEPLGPTTLPYIRD